ncbi:hypothetical protein [Pedobacter sp. Hv1]|uniref:hypothetical protein n=1 Tax=Pedobacter sp. Hv1 TaxID=1740090 RepID=UPI0006D8AB75|nr:hypothetical protein [Pedobacter sp. Hv1]KQC00870.1 hypothetical protein AQF98_09340 [Pedobacter sp. Hv1]
MKTTLKNLAVALILLVSAVSILSSCKKGGGGSIPNADKFPLTNFNITTTAPRVNGTSVYISYDIKNVSTKNYVILDNSQHIIYVRFTIATTDGTTYEQSRLIPDLQANTTSAQEVLLQMSSGKTLDPSKTKFELYYER